MRNKIIFYVIGALALILLVSPRVAADDLKWRQWTHDLFQIIIDRQATGRSGVHAIYIDGKNIRVETVEARRGRRPWTRHPRE